MRSVLGLVATEAKAALLKRKRLLIAIAPLAFAACGAEVEIERQAVETRDFVEGVIPIGLPELSARIRDGSLGRNDGDFVYVHLPGDSIEVAGLGFRSFGVRRSSFDETVPAGPLREEKSDDPAMDRYLRLPAEARKDDLFLNTSESWYSEYSADGKPLRFTCGFLLNLEADGPNQTRVEVLETNPKVWFGEKFILFGHGGAMGFVANIVPVPPTTRDRVEMLERIQSLGGHHDHQNR